MEWNLQALERHVKLLNTEDLRILLDTEGEIAEDTDNWEVVHIITTELEARGVIIER